MISLGTRRWEVPEAALSISLEEMRLQGLKGNEGTALWLGRQRDQDLALVTHVVCLRGAGVTTAHSLIHVEAGLINMVADVALALGAYIVGQIHSHGHGWGVGLSLTDRELGVRAPWFLSVVAPDYGLRPTLGLRECGVHVCLPGGHFVRLSPAAVRQRVAVTTAAVERIKVGNE